MTRKGFSLVELLVVVAVLSLLLFLASGSLRAGKQYSQSIVCAGNLKQITMAAYVYVQNCNTLPYGFNDTISNVPPGGKYAGNASYDWMGWWWFHYLYDSLGQDLSANGPLWCPSRFVLGETTGRNILCSNYGANFSLLKAYDLTPTREYEGTPIRPSNLTQPARTPFFLDSGYAWTTRHCAMGDPVTEFPNPKRTSSFFIPGVPVNGSRVINPDQKEDAINGRHLDRTINIGFADGHVEKQSVPNLFIRPEYSDGSDYCPLVWFVK